MDIYIVLFYHKTACGSIFKIDRFKRVPASRRAYENRPLSHNAICLSRFLNNNFVGSMQIPWHAGRLLLKGTGEDLSEKCANFMTV